MERGSVRWPNAATAVAAPHARRLAGEWGRPVQYLPNGIDSDERPDVACAEAMLHQIGLTSGSYALFAAARVDPTKGCLTLLRAWRLIGDPMPLLILGDLWHASGHETELRSAAEGMAVTFVPRIDDKATLLGLVASSRLFVFPSTVEAMSMMLLEVVSVGATVVASDIPENAEILPPSTPLFRAGDENDLARVIKETLRDSAATTGERGQHLAEWVRERYDWNRIAEDYLEVYKAAIGTPLSAPPVSQSRPKGSSL